VESAPIASIQSRWENILLAIRDAERHIPDMKPVAKKPWIRESTLELIARRKDARLCANRELERALHKAVKRSAKADRGAWLNDIVANGTWQGVKTLKCPRRVRHGRLRDGHGELVCSESRAETMATYLETVQWRVRPAQATDADPLGPELPVSLDPFTTEEVRNIVRKMRSGKAVGPDDIPAEYFKTLVINTSAVGTLTDFINCCWERKTVPSDWHDTFVSAIHKKGPTDECSNYRPISLLNIGYKAFAALVLSRLVDAGAEERLSKS
jgi:hypothetical protein